MITDVNPHQSNTISKVLITGSRGFTGQYLLAELEKNTAITAIEFQGDLLDNANLQRQIDKNAIDAIVHLAGISFVPDADSIKVYQIHTLASEKILKFATQSQTVKRVILASSSLVYGLNTHPKETDCPAPINHYGLSKLAMEQLAKNYQDKLEIVITRPFNYTGIGQAQQFLIPKLIYHFKQAKSILELGNMQIARDFSDVRWIAKVYTALLTEEHINGTYNLCSGKAHGLFNILQYLEQQSGHSPHYAVNPDFVRSNDLLSQYGCNKKLMQRLPKLNSIVFNDTLDWMLKG
jgi:nucleoside-diphosphate-sugar epimerase